MERTPNTSRRNDRVAQGKRTLSSGYLDHANGSRNRLLENRELKIDTLLETSLRPSWHFTVRCHELDAGSMQGISSQGHELLGRRRKHT